MKHYGNMAICSSQPGMRHIERGMLCQDISDAEVCGDCLVLTVCDGAGGSPIARESAELTRHCVNEYFAKSDMPFSDCSIDALKEDFIRFITDAYMESDYEYSQIASTCIVAAIKDNAYITLHVGDGNILVYDTHFHLSLFSGAYNQDSPNRTVFCSQEEEAVRTMQVYRGSLDENTAGFVLLSDGADALRQDPNKLRKLLALGAVAPNKGDEVCGNMGIEAITESPSGDDVSIGLITSLNDALFDAGVHYLTEIGYLDCGSNRLSQRHDVTSALLRYLLDGAAELGRIYERFEGIGLLRPLTMLLDKELILMDDGGRVCLN